MTIMVFGKFGQLATELRRQAHLIAIGRETANFENPESIASIIDEYLPDVVINAAAFTDVDRAEQEPITAEIVNAKAPTMLAAAAARRKIPLIHISTDFVFSGAGDEPWRVDDAPDPQSAYGASKLKGEIGVLAASDQNVVLRTSWVFSAHGTNFVKKILALGASKNQINVVCDQFGGPTPADALAAVCLNLARNLAQHSASGVYHLSGFPTINRADFAREIFRLSGQVCSVESITTDSLNSAARRPLNSRLECSRIFSDYQIKQPDWRQHILPILKELGHIGIP